MNGLPPPSGSSNISWILPDPSAPGTVLIGASWDVWRTTDSGLSWDRVLQHLDAGGLFLGPAVSDPFQPGVFYLSTGRAVYKSIDHGATWQLAGEVPLLPDVQEYTFIEWLGVDPEVPGTLYAVEREWDSVGALFVSADGGATWTYRAASPMRGSRFAIVNDGTRKFLMAAIVDGGTESDLFVSTDEGLTWQAQNLPGAGSIVLDPNTPGVLYSLQRDGFLRSTDFGTSWDRVTAEIPGVGNLWLGSIVLDPYDSSNIFASTFSVGILMSRDAGASWALSYEGMARENWASVDVAGEDSMVYAVSQGVLWKSANLGTDWAPASPPLTSPGEYAVVTDVATSPDDPLRVYVATESNGIFRSTDGAVTWTSSSSGLTSLATTWIDVAPSNAAILYASTPGRLFRSIDAGSSWTLANATPGLRDFQIDPFDPTIVFAYFNAVYRSTDSGVTFARPPVFVNAVSPYPTSHFTGVALLAQSPVSPGRSFLSLAIDMTGNAPHFLHVRSFHRSEDRLDTSAQLGSPVSRFLVADPFDADSLYSDLGRSGDAGATWQGLVPDYPENTYSLAAGSTSGRLFARSSLRWPAESSLFRLDSLACASNADCSQGNPCTTEICDNGVCTSSNAPDGTPCSDPSNCIAGGACEDGSCLSPTHACDDDNGCTYDVCLIGGGCMSSRFSNSCEPCHVDADCDDGSECSMDRCNTYGQCENTNACDDSDRCTYYTCEAGECVYPVYDFCGESNALPEDRWKLTIRTSADAASLKLKAPSNVERPPGSATDPSLSGVFIELFNPDGSTTEMFIPPGTGDPGWSVRGIDSHTSYRYRNTTAPAPVAKAKFSSNRLQLETSGGAVQPDASATRVGIRMQDGGHMWCALMEISRSATEKRFIADRAVPVADCTRASLLP
jgi:photosystem II stability/assembly factor-like uncharacterized protein